MDKKYKLPKEEAIDVLLNIESYYDICLTKKTQKENYVALRSLFNVILKNKLHMNDKEISDFYMRERNADFNRSTVWYSINNFEIYRKHKPFVEDMYAYYFIKPTEKDDVVEYVLDERLEKLLKPLKGYQLEEMIEHIELKLKSFKWKSKQPKNEYEIINCEV